MADFEKKISEGNTTREKFAGVSPKEDTQKSINIGNNAHTWSQHEADGQKKEAKKMLEQVVSWDTAPTSPSASVEKPEQISVDILDTIDIPPERYDFVSSLRGYLGVNTKNNPEVVKNFLMSGGANKNISEETAWCMGFVQSILRENGYSGKKTLWARDGLDIGVPTENPKPGDLVIVERSGGGHIGFYIGKSKDGNPLIIGGNQGESSEVTIKEETRKVLGYRSLDGMLGSGLSQLARK